MIWLRRQPPAYSPLPLGAVARAASAVVRHDANPRPTLGALLCRHYRADSAWLLGSGTQALQLALELARAAVGEPAPIVALPAFGCYDIATAAVGAGVRVTFYDLDPATLGPDGDSLRRALCRDGAQIVVVSPLYGIPVDWDAVTTLAAECGVLVIEDAAQGLGACWRGEPLGSLAPLSVLSFGGGTGWTGGAGGALLLRCRAPRPGRRLRMAGPLEDVAVLWRGLAQAFFGGPSWYRYRGPRPLRIMSRAAAAMLVETRAAAEAEFAARRVMGTRLLAYAEAVSPDGLVIPPAGGVPGYLRFPVRRVGGMGGLRSAARAVRLGVAPSYPLPLTHLRPLRPLKLHHHNGCHGAAELASGLITLPTHSLLTGEDFHQLLGLLCPERVTAPTRTATVVGALGESGLVFNPAVGTPNTRW